MLKNILNKIDFCLPISHTTEATKRGKFPLEKDKQKGKIDASLCFVHLTGHFRTYWQVHIFLSYIFNGKCYEYSKLRIMIIWDLYLIWDFVWPIWQAKKIRQWQIRGLYWRKQLKCLVRQVAAVSAAPSLKHASRPVVAKWHKPLVSLRLEQVQWGRPSIVKYFKK